MENVTSVPMASRSVTHFSIFAGWDEIYGTGLERAKASKLGVFIHNVFDASQDFWKMSKIGVSLSGDGLGKYITLF